MGVCMLDLPISSNNAERFGLHAEDRVTRGPSPGPITAETSGSIELTPPRVILITPELTAGDPELAAFCKAEQGKFRYHYVTFRATFLPDNAGFADARLAIQLGPNLSPDAVIAWSMSPQLLVDSKKISESAKLGIDFKLMKVEFDVGGVTPVQTWFLRRRNEQTATPFWEFQRTDVSAIDGQFCFHLVTRTVADLPAFGVLSARATINHRSFWIFRRSDTAARPASMRFDLPLTT